MATRPILTKPCARADRGCKGLCEAYVPSELKKRQCCSRSCGALLKIEQGWKPHATLTFEQRSKGGHRGGKIAGLHTRKRSAIRWAGYMERFLTAEFTDGLSEAQLARIRVLLARAVRIGHRRGYRSGHKAKRYTPRQRKAA